jgi:hypothetical protein
VLDLHAAYLGSKVEWSQACAQRFILIPADVAAFSRDERGSCHRSGQRSGHISNELSGKVAAERGREPGEHMTTNLMAAIALVGALFGAGTAMQATPQAPRSPDELVQALGEFPAAFPGIAPSTGVPSPIERRRREIYDRLWSLGPTALPTLCRGLADPDVQVRRNVALFLGVAGNDWYDRGRPRLAITHCAPALVGALEDSDS